MNSPPSAAAASALKQKFGPSPTPTCHRRSSVRRQRPHSAAQPAFPLLRGPEGDGPGVKGQTLDLDLLRLQQLVRRRATETGGGSWSETVLKHLENTDWSGAGFLVWTLETLERPDRTWILMELLRLQVLKELTHEGLRNSLWSPQISSE